MTDYDGNSASSTVYSGTKTRYIQYNVNLAQVQSSTLTYYKLSLYDSLGVRHYWVDTSAVTTNAPALGAGTYDYATFVVEQTF